MGIRGFIRGIIGVWGWAFCLNAPLPSGAQTASAPKNRITTLDYKPAPEKGMPLVRVRLNDGLRHEAMATFVLDTGFTQSMISDRLARILNLCSEPSLLADGTPACFADGRPLQQVTLALDIGGLAVDPCRFVLLKAYRLDLLDCPLDGVLGWDFLVEHAILFDFQAHRITLWQGGNLSGEELKAADMQDATVLPRANKTPGSFDVLARLNNQNNHVDAILAVDTGGAHTLISLADARLLELEPTRIGFPQRSIFGSLKSNEARVGALGFGGLHVNDLSVRYLLQEHPNMPPHLGLDVLAHYRLLIDYPARKLYLKPISTPLPIPEPNATPIPPTH